MQRIACEQAPCVSGKNSASEASDTPSSPDRSRLAPLVLDHTRLSRPKPNREPVRRLCNEIKNGLEKGEERRGGGGAIFLSKNFPRVSSQASRTLLSFFALPCTGIFFERDCPTKPYATIPKGIMGNRSSCSLN